MLAFLLWREHGRVECCALDQAENSLCNCRLGDCRLCELGLQDLRPVLSYVLSFLEFLRVPLSRGLNSTPPWLCPAAKKEGYGFFAQSIYGLLQGLISVSIQRGTGSQEKVDHRGVAAFGSRSEGCSIVDRALGAATQQMADDVETAPGNRAV